MPQHVLAFCTHYKYSNSFRKLLKTVEQESTEGCLKKNLPEHTSDDAIP
jgi:hypothetical protein